MNIKITKQQHEYLCSLDYNQYLFGSQLHGIANENSDYDYVRVISDEFYNNFKTVARYLPNIHSWQYDDKGIQYVWMTQTQFWHNLFSGDGNLISDIVLLSGEFNDALSLCRTYKIIKGYIGVARRDLKLHGNSDKKKFHALRSMYMAEKLMKSELPTVEGIQLTYNNYSGHYLPSLEALKQREQSLRERLTDMLNRGELDLYPRCVEHNDLVQLLADSNNIKQFKYES